MALETLKDVASVNGHMIRRVKWTQPVDNHIEINEEANAITFKIQNGPIKENGHNGCHLDEVIETSLLILQGLNKNFPCRENAIAITKLEESLMWLRERKRDKDIRGVEGQNKVY